MSQIYNKYSTIDKAEYGGRRSVYDILSLDPNNAKDWEIIKKEYVALDIDKVIINGNTFTNYGDFQFSLEKSYVKSPKRGGNGAIGNLNSYATFITPRLIINFSVMSIDDFRTLVRTDLERNEFIVECYDHIYNKRRTAKMYFTTLQMAKLYTLNKVRYNKSEWEDFIQIVGVRDYTVEMVGTNSDLELVSVVYHLNPPESTGRDDKFVGEDDVYMGQDIVIGGAASDFVNETFDGAYRFSKWNVKSEGGEKGVYLNGYAYTINADLVLYAQWEATTEHTLTFNYGIADPAINDIELTYETSRKVLEGAKIGKLPVAETPYVEVDNGGISYKYYPYYNGKWYRTPVKAANSVEVKETDLYWTNRDSTIYLLYDVYTYPLSLYLNGVLYQLNLIEYNTPMNLPNLVMDGYTFDGWYSTPDFQEGTKQSGLMPPHTLNLYARWIKQ